jgi:GNAT superfamily N-acetyltransferase
MPVRDATPADLAAIGSMIAELAEFERAAAEVDFDPADLAHHLFGPHPAAHVLIATVEGPAGPVVAGMAVWFTTFSTWVGRPGIWLEDLFVRPHHRRHGLATCSTGTPMPSPSTRESVPGPCPGGPATAWSQVGSGRQDRVVAWR